MSVTQSDKTCTVGQARAALVAAEARGVEGWSRVNKSLNRLQAWAILMGAVTADGGDNNEILDTSGLTASNIRREFGVDGQKAGLPQPKTGRRRKAEVWP